MSGKADKLINMQDAIEAICDEIMSRFDVGVTEGYELVEDALSGLPSADVPDTNVGDMISRKQAIEAMGEEPMVWNDDDAFALGERNQWERDVEAIKGVPSAEISADLIHLQKEQAYMQGYEDGRKPRNGLWIDIKHTFMTKCSVCDWINNDDSSYNFCPNCGSYNGGENEA